MSQGSSVAASGPVSASNAEKTATATATASARPPSTAPVPSQGPGSKLRSCLVCRSRKVRCDKQSPCSNCRRANIACVIPSADRPPRWARRLHHLTNKAPASNTSAPQDTNADLDKVMERLHNLEHLVKELSDQLEQARAAATSSTGGSASEVNSPESSTQHRDLEHENNPSSPATDISNIRRQFGRLVLQDASRSHYVSSAFWSRVDDELDGLDMDAFGLTADDSDGSWDEPSPERAPSSLEIERTPSERHAFLFRHNLAPSAPNLHELRPLPSQIPSILDIFSRNVNVFMQIVHIPTITKMVSGPESVRTTQLTPSDEALIFSISYAAVTSMEEDDVMTHFGAPKSELSLKYRLGLEHCLAKADFLTVPNLALVQAFALFLCLARRHDSPRFVWMMTGLVIRMAQFLGLQRDGVHFKHQAPFEIEMRRRLWWTLCRLDLRASEDQGTDLTIVNGSFDTKIPLNINDADIHPESKLTPTERYGVTDMTFARISAGIVDVMRQMMTLSAGDGVAGLEHQNHLLNEIYQKFEQEYFQHTFESGNIAYWVAVTVARMVMAKMTLIVFLPALFSTPGEHISDEIRIKLLVSAIEVAEYNHALNTEQACRHWRWLYQSHTHWHAIVYLLIEISQRPWSSTVERAWVALHSKWLIPTQALTDKNLRIWIPLRKLMTKALKHRDAELQRLRADPQAAAMLEIEDIKNPVPASSGPFSAGSSVDVFRERWRQLVAMPTEPPDQRYASQAPNMGLAGPTVHGIYTQPLSAGFVPSGGLGDLDFHVPVETPYLGTNGQQFNVPNPNKPKPPITTDVFGALASNQAQEQSYNSNSTVPHEWADGRTMGPGFYPWLWADADPSVDVFSNWDVDSVDANIDLGGEVNWYDWVKSARGTEWDARPM
ncbi:uncharacterized protein PV07_05317 [Cladophialophora immunda]|uniref:Zn(2)-C6 fungal-type domain-containing protein n=1 Tax=Cladophialophora immunda TaxID=569365 RepID=A0A0D2D195_9EURO|nr:uncharacterized protein PV07_05317 [Cladophialophora immunda]KIW29504.1 hypothetical protein PV07_05317 [Cladophialophora immunda]OQV00672.1 Fungal specific transcription factor domain-containing protein [Cladophialophora immunda]